MGELAEDNELIGAMRISNLLSRYDLLSLVEQTMIFLAKPNTSKSRH